MTHNIGGFLCPICKKEKLRLFFGGIGNRRRDFNCSARCENCEYYNENVLPEHYIHPELKKLKRKEYMETLMFCVSNSSIKKFNNEKEFEEFLKFWQIPKKYNSTELIEEINKK
jgi:hypothetical protein